jgi:hypothetical protein
MSVQLIWKPDSSCNQKKPATLGSRLMNSHRWTVRQTLMPYDQQSSISRYYQLQTSYQFWLFGLENLHSTRMFCETVNHSESLYMWMQLAKSTMM